ncbi:glycosyltransferase family 2 protein [Agromyces seonyuensis]|uniref:Glycosyltransferase n=1 Tax=Agromyces seonyuensis TaxID=2662446 RepID=A0A6I4P0Z6_9MICO|nr:glycosyltransferase [Agromyces seonyuensis]MWB99192.1 glycosyltransferase [Agromyces seonyuensis]
MPRLSVLMSAKDAAATIRSAMRSTLRAMPRDAELVVLDDGSTDATGEIADSLGDRRVQVLRQETNIGISAARRRLLAETDSPLVAVMDADDVSLPWRFAVQTRAVDAGADLVVAPCVNFRRSPFRLRPGNPAPITAAAMPLHLVLGCPLVHPTLVAKRSALEAVGGYRADAVAEDYDLYLRAAAAGLRLVRVGTPVLAYRLHDSQTSGNAAYHRRADADLGLEASFQDFVRAEFGPEAALLAVDDGLDDPAVARTLVRAEFDRRGLDRRQRSLVARYFRHQRGEAL